MSPSTNPGYFDQLLDQLKLIEEEVGELREELEQRSVENLDKIAKELGDVEVTALGLFYRAGLDYNDVMGELVRSLNTRFDEEGSERARDTRDYYERELGVPVESRVRLDEEHDVTYEVLVVAESATDVNGRYYPKGKGLKSVHSEGFDVENIDLPS
jgi:NTP pyrophosphatase (non-canonical NTP hydrolase)